MKKLIIIALILLAGCGNPNSGIVTDKYWYEAYDRVEYMHICNGTTTTLIPYTQHYPAMFYLEYRSITIEYTPTNKPIVDTVYTTVRLYKEDWDRFNMGDTIIMRD